MLQVDLLLKIKVPADKESYTLDIFVSLTVCSLNLMDIDIKGINICSRMGRLSHLIYIYIYICI